MRIVKINDGFFLAYQFFIMKIVSNELLMCCGQCLVLFRNVFKVQYEKIKTNNFWRHVVGYRKISASFSIKYIDEKISIDPITL